MDEGRKGGREEGRKGERKEGRMERKNEGSEEIFTKRKGKMKEKT